MTGGDARKAFTLIEMMLTIALITLLSSLFVWNITSLLKQGELESLQYEIWGAVEKAKQSAVFNRQPHVVRFDEEAQAFRVSAGGKQFTFEVETDGFDDVPTFPMPLRIIYPLNDSSESINPPGPEQKY